jgi:hypothetical protein
MDSKRNDIMAKNKVLIVLPGEVEVQRICYEALCPKGQ